MLEASEIETLKREIKLEIMKEMQLAEKPCDRGCNPIRRTHWYEVHQHLGNRVLELEKPRTRPYWMLYESIRSIIRPTFNIRRVEWLEAKDVPAAIYLVDQVIGAIKQARGEIKLVAHPVVRGEQARRFLQILKEQEGEKDIEKP